MTTVEALQIVGFEVIQSPEQYAAGLEQGRAPEPPHFSHISAWHVSPILWIEGVRTLGEFLVCEDPQGNVRQYFDLSQFTTDTVKEAS